MDKRLGIEFFGGNKESGDVFIVETKAEAGYRLESHVHEHAHLSALVSGVADVTIGDKTERVDGYKILTIPQGVSHSVVAVTNIVWLCIWNANIAPVEQANESLKFVRE